MTGSEAPTDPIWKFTVHTEVGEVELAKGVDDQKSKSVGVCTKMGSVAATAPLL